MMNNKDDYFESIGVRLLHGDCLDLMGGIQDKSIDMILCDLPYGVLNRSNPSAKWDCVIDFDRLWEQYKRITKPNAAIVLFAQGMFTAQLMMSNPKWWRYNLVWDKCRTTGFLNANRMPLRSHEDIIVFYNEMPLYNPQMIKCEPYQRSHSRGNGKHKITQRCYGDFKEADFVMSDYKFPKSIVAIPKGHALQYHPTEKPVALLEYLIRTDTNEGDLVLDNTAGSMSTAIAAIGTNRKCICIEKDDNYFAIGQKRVDEKLKETINQQLKIF
jgi:site-specific DNA-methyltransferase (adenine-specific)